MKTPQQFNVLVEFSYRAVVPIWAEDEADLNSILDTDTDDEWFIRAHYNDVKFEDREALVISVDKVGDR